MANQSDRTILDGQANSTMPADYLAPERRRVRSSLACLPCRSRHLKCDNIRPICSRCAQLSKECVYAESRRGGLDRAALAERRKRLEKPAPTSADNGNPPRTANTPTATQPSFNPVILDGVGVADTPSGSAAPVLSDTGIFDVDDDPLIDAYYENFHKFHPVALPRKHLARFYQDPNRPINLRPLVTVIRFIGNLYRSKEWSTSLKGLVEAAFLDASPTDAIMVQCRLLYSIALFWYDYKTESKQEMDHSIRIALEIQVFRREFATEHGQGDSVLIESWRRTWWSLYVVEGYYAGTLGTKDFTVINVDAHVELPCQEAEYESGVSMALPYQTPKRIQSFFFPTNLYFYMY